MTQELKPNSIHFQTCEPTKCVMRIEADRIWVDPNIEVTEAAALVLQALEANIKRLVLAEREWVELTDYEIVRLYAESPMCDSEMIAFARAVIAAFKEKNK